MPYIKPYTLARFEFLIFCSYGVDYDHYIQHAARVKF
jgi:hypothetical protein